jgi:SAM-dependent methyltransferase
VVGRQQPSTDAGAIVRNGYDALEDLYLQAFSADDSSPRSRYLNVVLARLGPESIVLDLGCGPGRPVAATLAQRCRVMAIDLSRKQLELARRHAPTALLVQADMTQLHVAAATLEAVVAFYSLIHVPRELLGDLLARVARWLEPGGVFVASLGAGDSPDSVEEDWLGVPMFFSHFDAATNLRLVERAGLLIESSDVIQEVEHDGKEVSFLWVVASKPDH